jgi:carbon monoxide dehydrogenase subunit G
MSAFEPKRTLASLLVSLSEIGSLEGDPRNDLTRVPKRNCVLNFVGEITVAAPREAVFKALSDAPFFASCIEGVRDLKAIDATHYDAVLETRIAYMRFNFKVGVQLSRVTPSEEIEAKVEGTPMGMVGRLTATATTRLADADGGTVIRYSVDATLTGKLGSMGQPVLKAKAKEMEKQFSARLAAAFADERPGAPP